MKRTNLITSLHAACSILAMLANVSAFSQPGTITTLAVPIKLHGEAVKNIMMVDDPNAPILHRLQGGDYNQTTHQYYPFYVNKNYVVHFTLNRALIEGYVIAPTGGTTVGQPGSLDQGQIQTHIGNRKPVHHIEYWGLTMVVRKNGADYKTIPFSSQGDWGDTPPPYDIFAKLSGEGEYSFYSVQTFPDSAAIRVKLTSMFRFNYPSGNIDYDDLNQSVNRALIKYQDLAGKTVYTLVAKFAPKKDFLVASLGDSFSSGEGNPTKCGQYSTGAKSFLEETVGYIAGAASDLVKDIFSGNFEKNFIHEDKGLADFLLGNSLVTTLTGECQACRNTIFNHTGIASCHFATLPDWLEPGAHRSYRSGIALSSFQLERNHYGVASTFVSFATSGAKAANLYLTPQHSWQDRSQLDELVRAVGNRRIDALVLSAGGNDAGFADVITNLAKGDWQEFEFWTDASARPQLRTRIEAAIRGLKQQYADMNAKIRRNLNVGKIYILEYPTPLFSKTDANGRIVDGPSCGMLSIGNFNIDHDDAVFIRQMGAELNAAVRQAAAELGWVYVGGVAQAFDGHGYCSAEPYYEGAETSCNCQGNTNGVLHPNSKGQDILKNLLMKAIERDYNLDANALAVTH